MSHALPWSNQSGEEGLSLDDLLILLSFVGIVLAPCVVAFFSQPGRKGHYERSSLHLVDPNIRRRGIPRRNVPLAMRCGREVQVVRSVCIHPTAVRQLGSTRNRRRSVDFGPRNVAPRDVFIRPIRRKVKATILPLD